MTFELSAIVQNTPPAVLAKALKNQGNCPLCNVGHVAYKLKRQAVHHFPETGNLIVCKAAELKPSS